MPEQQAGGNFIASILPLIVLFAIFYFLIIRPQQKQAKQHRDMLESLSKGDKVVTSGGLIAEITKVEEDFFKALLSDKGEEIRIAKDFIAKKYESSSTIDTSK